MATDADTTCWHINKSLSSNTFIQEVKFQNNNLKKPFMLANQWLAGVLGHFAPLFFFLRQFIFDHWLSNSRIYV